MQVAATLGFVLGRRNGQFLKGLRPKEMDAIREILVWGRQPLNNKVLEFYGGVLEKFDTACRKLMSRVKSVLPQGCPRARIRATSREIRQPRESTLGETLGEETTGLVVVDPEGHPLKYNQLSVYESIIAKQAVRVRIDVDIPGNMGEDGNALPPRSSLTRRTIWMTSGRRTCPLALATCYKKPG